MASALGALAGLRTSPKEWRKELFAALRLVFSSLVLPAHAVGYRSFAAFCDGFTKGALGEVLISQKKYTQAEALLGEG